MESCELPVPVVLWLLAEPLSLEGEANGAEMQLPVWVIIRRGKQTNNS